MLSMLLVAQAPQKTTLPGATNVTRVDATVMCGGATTPAAFTELKKLGFNAIVNLRREQEPGADIPGSKAAASGAGLRYIHIPFDSSNPDPKIADTFIAAVTDKTNQPVYIHCASANRVGALWLIKRVLVDGWDVPRATEEATAIGLTHPGLKKYALDYVETHKKAR